MSQPERHAQNIIDNLLSGMAKQTSRYATSSHGDELPV